MGQGHGTSSFTSRSKDIISLGDESGITQPVNRASSGDLLITGALIHCPTNSPCWGKNITDHNIGHCQKTDISYEYINPNNMNISPSPLSPQFNSPFIKLKVGKFQISLIPIFPGL